MAHFAPEGRAWSTIHAAQTLVAYLAQVPSTWADTERSDCGWLYPAVPVLLATAAQATAYARNS